MPVRRGPDGKIIEEKSKPTPSPNVKRDENTLPQSDGANRPPVSPGGGQAPGGGRLEKDTVQVGQRSTAPGGWWTSLRFRARKERTRTKTLAVVIRRQGPQPSEERTEKADGMDDPVVGWLAIVEGPGKGRALQLGYGSNPIGRGETARVKLNFGDDQISRGGHAVVTYDPGAENFTYSTAVANLTYLNDEPVLTPTELPALESY